MGPLPPRGETERPRLSGCTGAGGWANGQERGTIFTACSGGSHSPFLPSAHVSVLAHSP